MSKKQAWSAVEKKEFRGALLAIVIPVALQNLLSAVVSASDALMLGVLDQESLSSISLATQINFVMSLFIGAVTIGTTVLAAQYWGKEDVDTVEKVLGIGIKFVFPVTFIFFLLAFFAPGFLMGIYTNDPILIELGIPYLRIVSFSYLCMGVSHVYLTIMKNSGRTFLSTVYGSSAVVINFILNWLLIYGIAFFPKMEIRGAAIATLIARIVELMLCLFENMKKDVVKIKIKSIFTTYERLQKDFVTYTTPVLCNLIAWGCGFSMFSVIMGHLGSDAVAANSITNIVKNIMICGASGVSAGAGIIVGNELGRSDFEKARKYGDRLCHIAISIGAIVGIMIVIASPVIVSMATTLTDTAREYLRYMLLVCGYYMIGSAANKTTISGIFCAGGDTKFGFICDTITMWAFCVPLGALAAFVFKWPVLVVFFILNLDEMVKLPAVYMRYKKYKWLRNITNEE
ncbi:MAG: MATE family efflux transporter [Lachnospiraceae bacterium]|nr:MATE family efflux transporter [Lachnospiraceae bacterium]